MTPSQPPMQASLASALHLSIQTYFDVVHKHTPDTALIGLSTIIGSMAPSTRWYQKRYLSKLISDVQGIGSRANVYARITPLQSAPDKGRGLENASIGASVLWVDYDTYDNVANGLAALDRLPHPPTLIVSSGNGLHAYWQLDRLYSDLDGIKARNKQLALDLNGVTADDAADSCFDLARILRVPGTYNIKREPLPCSIVNYAPDRVYTLDQFNPATLIPQAVNAWDHEVLPIDFLERLRDIDKKLVKRIMSEATAIKADAPMNGTGIDRSRNDGYIAVRLLALGYSPGIVMSVLMHPEWLSGSKYNEKMRYDYVVTTVNTAITAHAQSPDRYFARASFVPDRLTNELMATQPYIYVAEQLYRYIDGVYVPDADVYIKRECVARLGPRWSSKARDETIKYIIDQSRISVDQINQHEPLINCANGMLDPRTWELLPHDPQYISTVQVPCLYDPDADPTALDTFIHDVLPADSIPFFWEYVGSAFLMGRYWPKAFMALIGPPNSGKSKLLEWLMHFYGGSANVSTFSLQTLADNKFATVSLFGKVANIFADLDEAEAQSTGMIKALTGDDNVAAERKFGGFVTFKNTARLFYSANHYPAVRSPDEAFFYRARILPCNNVFTGSKADRAIVDKLSTPAVRSAGLLRAAQGLARLLQHGDFSHSASVHASNSEYRYAADTVSGFLQSCLLEPQYAITKQAMYQMYRHTCDQGGRRSVNEDKFFKRVADNLTRFGMLEEYRTNEDGTRSWYYVGRKPATVRHGTYPLVMN